MSATICDLCFAVHMEGPGSQLGDRNNHQGMLSMDGASKPETMLVNIHGRQGSGAHEPEASSAGYSSFSDTAKSVSRLEAAVHTADT